MIKKLKRQENPTKPRAFRVSIDLWKKLTNAAEQNHRSITGELAFRLERTFDGEIK